MTVRIFSAATLFAALTATALAAGCSDPPAPSATGGSVGSGGEATGSGGEATGSGGGDVGSGGGATDPTVPTDTSQAGIEAFLAAGSYKTAPWTFDAAVRDGAGLTTPHGRVQVFYNPTAVASIEGGKNVFGDDPGNTVSSMAVKELYDAADAYLGAAVMLRVAATGSVSDWVYYCSSTAGGCINEEDSGTFYYQGGFNNCSTCHGGVFFGPLPP